MSSGVLGVAFSPDDTEVMAGEERIARAMAWNIEDVAGGEWAALPVGDRGEWTTVAAAGDGRHVLTPGREHPAAVWDPRTGQQVREYGGDGLATRVAAGGGLVAATSDDAIVTAWNAEPGEPPHRCRRRHRQRTVVWDVERGETVYAIEASANNLTFTRDGTRLAIAQRDGVATIRHVTGRHDRLNAAGACRARVERGVRPGRVGDRYHRCRRRGAAVGCGGRRTARGAAGSRHRLSGRCVHQ